MFDQEFSAARLLEWAFLLENGICCVYTMVYVYTERRRGMSKQTAVRLSEETYARLQALAGRTGRTATYYIREAIETHLDDLEDIYLAEQVVERIRRGEEEVLSSAEFWRDLDH